MVRGDKKSTGTWLFDTGATVSLISKAQARKLGLFDSNNNPTVTPQFELTIGGVGGTAKIPGFEVDKVSVPTRSGFKLVYSKARIAVHDVSVFDEKQDRFITLDGVFGSNFLCSSALIVMGFPSKINGTVFDHVIFDTEKSLLGFDVLTEHEKSIPAVQSVPPQIPGDISHDDNVNVVDLAIMSEEWGRTDSNKLNAYCSHSDINRDGKVDVIDLALLADDWLKTVQAQ